MREQAADVVDGTPFAHKREIWSTLPKIFGQKPGPPIENHRKRIQIEYVIVTVL